MDKKLVEIKQSFEFETTDLTFEEQVIKLEDGKEKTTGYWRVPFLRVNQMTKNGMGFNDKGADKILAHGQPTVVYDGHFDFHKSFAQAVGVAKDVERVGNILFAKYYPTDKEFNDKLLQLHKLGLKIGTSTVGYGMIGEDKMIVAETYRVARYFDFVLRPAADTFVKPKEIKQEESEDKEDTSVEESESSVELQEQARLLSLRYKALTDSE